MARAYRLRVTKWPTPDGRPFDCQPAEQYEASIGEYFRDEERTGWMAAINWRFHVNINGVEPTPGVWLRGPDGWNFTVPAHRRNLFFTYDAAHKRLAYLQTWGAVGHIETSEPITWPERRTQ